jgi:hypothetical protein
MTRKRETKSAAVYYDESTYLFAGENRNTNAGMKRPSPTFAGLGFWPVPSGQEGLQSGARCMEKLNMRNRDDKNQCDRETKTRPPVHEGKRTIEKFWRYQLDRVKELAESQAKNEKNDSYGNQ